jgi:hypothetical protein
MISSLVYSTASKTFLSTPMETRLFEVDNLKFYSSFRRFLSIGLPLIFEAESYGYAGSN